MSQIVKIECQACEGVETYELEQCFLIGKREDGQLLFTRHEMEVVDALHALVDYLAEEVREKDKGEP